MEELIKQGQWWWPYLVPTLTGIFALWIGTKFGKATEHSQWLRNEKRQAYQKYLQSGKFLAQMLNRTPAQRDQVKEDMQAHLKTLFADELDFFAPKHLEKPLKAFNSSVTDAFAYEDGEGQESMTRGDTRQKFSAAYGDLRDAMRKDLGIKN